MKRVIAACCIALLSGCALKSTPASSAITYFPHRVQYQGETLGQISSWYTGNATNWKAIQQHNPGLNPKRMKVGDTILIPEPMVVKRNALPKPKLQVAKSAPAPIVVVTEQVVIPVEETVGISEFVPEEVEETAVEETAREEVQPEEMELEVPINFVNSNPAPSQPNADVVPVKHVPTRSRADLWQELLKEE